MRHPALKILVATLIFSVPFQLARSQQPDIEPARYTISGDQVLIEVDESGARHLYADGNVLLSYALQNDEWTLSAAKVEFIEQLPSEGEEILPVQTAYAEGNIVLTGAQITLTAPGSITVDLIARTVVSDSDDIHLAFPDGEIETDNLAIRQEGAEAYMIETAERTVAQYSLSSSIFYTEVPGDTSSESFFGSLRFDFSTITMETERTQLQIAGNRPTSLICPDPAVITTSTNRLTMPSCNLGFDPPTLSGDSGAELAIGRDTVLSAGTLLLTYPEEGGMYVEFAGCAPGDGEETGLPERVTITHPAGIFSAGSITVEVHEDGTSKIHASGDACFEVPLVTFTDIATEEGE
jgi:hypothetical protein